MLPVWVPARTVMVCSPKRSVYKVGAGMHQLLTGPTTGDEGSMGVIECHASLLLMDHGFVVA